MAGPTTADVEALKRCIRFLLKYPRCIQSFERQEIVTMQFTCFSDSKLRWLVAEPREREFLQNLPRETSSEAVVSLSGAEAECYAAVKAAASGIGCVSMMCDLGVVLQQGVEVKAKG